MNYYIYIYIYILFFKDSSNEHFVRTTSKLGLFCERIVISNLLKTDLNLSRIVQLLVYIVVY